MKDMRSNIMKTVGKLLAIVLGTLVLHACESAIYDTNEDCTVNYLVKFKYDYNMKFADAFAHEVNTVTLYLVDEQGKVAWQKTEQGDRLAAPDYAMSVEGVKPGKYDLLVWAGTTDKGSFDIPQTTVATELGCTLQRQYTDDGEAYVDRDLDRLFHGYLPAQVFTTAYGEHEYTVSLVKNTNVVRLVLQHLSGEPMDKDQFCFTITDNNGRMAWDNTVLPDEELTYYAWHTAAGLTGIGSGGQAAYSAVIAEMTVARLMTDHSTRLTVTRCDTGETVLSIPLIDYALLVKGYYNRDMADQEYLDRQDEYDLVFILDDGLRWIDSYIYINSWKIVLQNKGL